MKGRCSTRLEESWTSLVQQGHTKHQLRYCQAETKINSRNMRFNPVTLFEKLFDCKVKATKRGEGKHKIKSKILIILRSLKILIIFKALSNLSSLEYLHQEGKVWETTSSMHDLKLQSQILSRDCSCHFITVESDCQLNIGYWCRRD